MPSMKLAIPLLFALLAGCAATARDSRDPAESPAEDPDDKPQSNTKKSDVGGADDDDDVASTSDRPTEPAAPASPSVPSATPVSPVIAWYADGTTTGTGSFNDFGKLGVTADTVTIAQLAKMMETSKYGDNLPRKKDTALDFDEVFLARATNASFMGKLAPAVARVLVDGWKKVIVYNNGPRSMAEAAKGGWAGIAKAGAVVGLEAYTTTFWPDVKAFQEKDPFQDAPDTTAAIAANPALFEAFKGRLAKYVTDAKAQLGDPSLHDHLSLLQYEKMVHDVVTIQKWGWSLEKATHFADLWYAAMKDVAKAESIRWGIYHPA
jgi:hypothetical protein